MEGKKINQFEKLKIGDVIKDKENNLENEYMIIEYIDSGGFGNIYKAKILGNNDEILIIKENYRSYLEKEKIITDIITEKGEMNENLAHYGLIYKDAQKNKTYFTSKYYNGGNLSQFIKNCKEITMEMIQYIMIHIIHGLKFLHSKDICHKDIKPQNILIHYENEEDRKKQDILKSLLVIVDFSISKKICKNIKDDYDNPNEGTINYRHPKLNEILFLNKKENITLKKELDIWSLGLVCLELFTKKLTFDYNKAKGKKEKKNLAESQTYEIPLNDNTYIEFVSFIDNMLQYNPENQLQIEQLQNHEFLKKKVESFTEFPKKKAGDKLKNDSLVLNFRNGLNFKYEELYGEIKDDKEEITNKINEIFIYLNENSLFTNQIFIPIIPKIEENENH